MKSQKQRSSSTPSQKQQQTLLGTAACLATRQPCITPAPPPQLPRMPALTVQRLSSHLSIYISKPDWYCTSSEFQSSASRRCVELWISDQICIESTWKNGIHSCHLPGATHIRASREKWLNHRRHTWASSIHSRLAWCTPSAEMARL
jgi:hypothetical protein